MKKKMKSLIDIIESIHPKCTKLDFEDFDEFSLIMITIIGTDVQKLTKRIFDPEWDNDPDTLFIDFIAYLQEISKSDVRRLIKNNGIKVNNKFPTQDLKVRDIPWIELGEWKVCVVKLGKNKFDFILWS